MGQVLNSQFFLIVSKILWQYSQDCSYRQNKNRRIKCFLYMLYLNHDSKVSCLAFKSNSFSMKKKFQKSRIRIFIWIFTLGSNILVFGKRICDRVWEKGDIEKKFILSNKAPHSILVPPSLPRTWPGTHKMGLRWLQILEERWHGDDVIFPF